MADKALNRVYFPIYRETTDDAQRSNPDPLGYFSCRLSTARFLDIEDKIKAPIITSTRSGSATGRSLTLADGTKLEQATGQIQIPETKIVLASNPKGSRTVVLKTGNLIEDTTRKKGRASAFHTISFRFPSFATILNIADALGTLIPPGKIGAPPGQTEIWGLFTVLRGRTYPIQEQASAKADAGTDVPLSDAELASLAAKASGKKEIKKAA